MTLEELLDHIGTHVLDDRAPLIEGSPDSLYSDELLVRYLNEGQRLFCRKAWPIIDSTSQECCEITPVANTGEYPLHSSVVRVLSVTPADSDVPLQWINWNLMVGQTYLDFPTFLEHRYAFTAQSARPGFYSTDEQTRSLRIRPRPTAEQATAMGLLRLRVARMPLVLLTVREPTAAPEIPQEYHLELCNYAAGRALVQANVDDDSKQRGKELIAEFMSNIRSAKIDQIIAQKGPPRFIFGGWASER